MGSTNGQRATGNIQLATGKLATEVAILLSTQNADRLADAIKYLREAPVDDAHHDVDDNDDDPMDGSLEVHIILI